MITSPRSPRAQGSACAPVSRLLAIAVSAILATSLVPAGAFAAEADSAAQPDAAVVSEASVEASAVEASSAEAPAVEASTAAAGDGTSANAFANAGASTAAEASSVQTGSQFAPDATAEEVFSGEVVWLDASCFLEGSDSDEELVATTSDGERFVIQGGESAVQTYAAGPVDSSGAFAIGIDVSYAQGVIDWEKVSQAGVDFAIIQLGYGNNESSQDDKQAYRNIIGCETYGIPYGGYIFSYAYTTQMAVSEAQHALRVLSGRVPSLGVYLDLENDHGRSRCTFPKSGALPHICDSNSEDGVYHYRSNQLLADMAKAFCNTLIDAGVTPGIYASTSWWNDYFDAPVFSQHGRWIAQYNTSCTYGGDVQIWQYSDSGRIDGIDGYVDMNYLYGEDTIPVKTFTCQNADGTNVTNAWRKIDGGWYYFGADGVSCYGLHTIKGYKYYFNQNCRMITGWHRWSNGTWSYFSPSQSPVGHMITGWLTINDTRYYFDSNGIMVTGLQEISGSYYYFSSSGSLYTGWYKWPDGTWSYFSSDASPSGSILTGWRTINGKKYYLDPSNMGKTAIGLTTINGSQYYFNSSAALTYGWLTINGNEYYANTTTGKLATGSVQVGSYRYFFDASGVRKTSGWQKLDGIWYFLDASAGDTHKGCVVTGWLKRGSTWYYLNSPTGAMAIGWKDVGSARYYFKDSGAMVSGWQDINGDTYYFASSGALRTGWQNIGSYRYHFDQSTGAMDIGWVKLSGTWYFLDDAGRMATGWLKRGSTWYYLDATTGAMATGWLKRGSAWYYLKDSGAMATGWVKLSGTWYYLDPSSGRAQVGSRWIDGKRYYFKSSCAMYTGWLQWSDGTWSYFGSSGAAYTGTHTISGKTYRFDADGIWIS